MSAPTIGTAPVTRTVVEDWVRTSWQGLGLQVAGPESNFFAIGGSSLAAARFIAQVEDTFGEDALLPEDLYESPTLQAITDTITAYSAANPA
jgi:hypothetical protein